MTTTTPNPNAWFSRLKRMDVGKLKSLNTDTLRKPWEGKWSAKLQGEAVNLDASIRAITPIIRTIDATSIANMAGSIGQLPKADESLHLWIGGKSSMGHILAAILKLSAPATVEALHTATLSFSKDNVNEWCGYIDDGIVKAVTVICSQYFEKTSPDIFQYAQSILLPRGGKIFSIRSHCKIIAAKLSDGQTITATGSANTRSAKTLEQVELFGHPDVYAFHVSQMKRAEAMSANQMELPE